MRLLLKLLLKWVVRYASAIVGHLHNLLLTNSLRLDVVVGVMQVETRVQELLRLCRRRMVADQLAMMLMLLELIAMLGVLIGSSALELVV